MWSRYPVFRWVMNSFLSTKFRRVMVLMSEWSLASLRPAQWPTVAYGMERVKEVEGDFCVCVQQCTVYMYMQISSFDQSYSMEYWPCFYVLIESRAMSPRSVCSSIDRHHSKIPTNHWRRAWQGVIDNYRGHKGNCILIISGMVGGVDCGITR
jgi:hypothetical protein